ncbi:MAG TPA: LytTR family DNA-binding domain-containing protein [Ensifer sp.]|jgi:two-component system response regulator AlgR|uniref:LytR/AlgR family response regulator transcription factor n=1 Tax=Ensifer sp. TaxID=1872086 RepID=UPI002E0F2300|nr:LytTR family DNA-binding domain-containing protein [Ensifer sp.]
MNDIQTAPLSVLVIDDEPLARRRLLRLLGTMPGVEVVGVAGNVQQACGLISQLLPDMILLDIQMPGGTGFDILERLGDNAPAVVFVTAFDHYALRAFEAAAIDYVTKPIEVIRLRTAVERARVAIAARTSTERVLELNETVLALRQALRKHETQTADLWIKSRGEFVRIALDRVVRFQAERDYVRIHVEGRSYLHHESLTSLERRLDPAEFLRLHRSSIVRRDCIVGLKQAPFAALIALLSDGSEIRVGRTYSRHIRPMTGERPQLD